MGRVAGFDELYTEFPVKNGKYTRCWLAGVFNNIKISSISLSSKRLSDWLTQAFVNGSSNKVFKKIKMDYCRAHYSLRFYLIYILATDLKQYSQNVDTLTILQLLFKGKRFQSWKILWTRPLTLPS